MDIYTKAYDAPTSKFQDLRAVITSRLAAQAIPVSLRTYAVIATEDTDFTLLTIQVPNRRLQFQRRGDVMHAGLEIYGQLVTLSGRIVQVFEKGLDVDVPEKDFPEWNNRDLVYQEAAPLRPAIYKLSVVVKDSQNGQMGSAEQGIRVPSFDTEMLTNSSLILADEVGAPQADSGASDPFLIGGNRVVPNGDHVFSRQKELGIYTEIYGLAIDPATHKTSFAIEFRILREGKTILDQTQKTHGPSIVYVVEKKVHLNSLLLPGDYKLELRITDLVRTQAISPNTMFKLR